MPGSVLSSQAIWPVRPGDVGDAWGRPGTLGDASTLCVQCGPLEGAGAAAIVDDHHQRRVNLIERQRDPQRERSGVRRATMVTARRSRIFDANDVAGTTEAGKTRFARFARLARSRADRLGVGWLRFRVARGVGGVGRSAWGLAAAPARATIRA